MNQLKLLKKMINPIALTKNGSPIIQAIRFRCQLIFWCKYCNRIHRHGLEDGYRVPHCSLEGYSNECNEYYIQELKQ